MLRHRLNRLLVLSFLLFQLFLNQMTATQTQPAPDQLALIGGTIYVSPTENPISNGVVLVRDGRISAVGSRATVKIPRNIRTLNCSGLTIMPGFWNSHVHFFERKWAEAGNLPAPELTCQLQSMLTRYGFTSVFDLGSQWENTRQIRDRIDSGEVSGPKIRSTGEAILGKGWMPPAMVLKLLGVMEFPTPEVTSASEALAVSKKLLDAGTDGLKLFAAQPAPPNTPLPDEVIRAIVTEAHHRDKPVFAHPTNQDGLLAAVRGGVDIIAHTTPHSGPWDESVIEMMRQAKVALIPTLKIFQYHLRHDRVSLSDQLKATSTGQLRAWVASGGITLFGTDVGGMDDYDPSDEYAFMSEAGMTFHQIFTSLTTSPAEKFGKADKLGKVVAGYDADLVVLNQDPSQDIRAFASVRYTVKAGKLIFESVP
jgi:imidazolonepropionase-like amidohydrolase